MKILVSAIFLVLLAVTENTCRNKKNKNKAAINCYKGRLEIKGGCMNYTIAITEGNIDSSLVQASWTDENTGKNYKNVFALGSKCTFPNHFRPPGQGSHHDGRAGIHFLQHG